MGIRYSHLSPDERIRIERLHCEQGLSVRETARLVGRDKATVSRELKRGPWFASNENESYRPYRPKRLKTGPWTSMPFHSALAAQRRADLRRHESRKPHRMDSDRLRSWVMDALRRGWSPEPIEGRLKLEYPGDPVMRVSHECLHQWIHAKPQRDLDLRQYLPRGRKHRARRKGRKVRGPRNGNSASTSASHRFPPSARIHACRGQANDPSFSASASSPHNGHGPGKPSSRSRHTRVGAHGDAGDAAHLRRYSMIAVVRSLVRGRGRVAERASMVSSA